MNKIDQPPRWYERAQWPYAKDQQIVAEYADWLRKVDWQLFATFTFAWRVSDAQADKTFREFINRLETSFKCNVAYVRGDEKRFSGCGKPACARHYHTLLASEIPLQAEMVEVIWKSLAGNRSDDAGAKVEIYDSHRNGLGYVLKCVNDHNQDNDWDFRKLHLFHPEVRSLLTLNARLRRTLRRQKARSQMKSGSFALVC